jgi:DNA-binding cell septation regulator SpoVG
MTKEEPRFGYTNLIKSKKSGKIKAFFSVLLDTEEFGTIEINGFKIIQGTKGDFISFPSRAVSVEKDATVTTAGGEKVSGKIPVMQYYDNFRFSSLEQSNDFKSILKDKILPKIEAELAKK